MSRARVRATRPAPDERGRAPDDAIVVTVAQVMLALLVVAASIFLTRPLHDAVPSAIRSGVASGVGALSWIAFLPFALVFGVVTKHAGVHTAGWMITAATVLAGALLIRLGLDQGAKGSAEAIIGVEAEAAPATAR